MRDNWRLNRLLLSNPRLVVRDVNLAIAIAKTMTLLTNLIFATPTRTVILPFKSCDVSLEAT